MSGHTPGPWMAKDSRLYNFAFDVDDANGSPVAEVCSKHGGQDDEARANARLIAAAPDMLEALRAAKEWSEAWLDDESRVFPFGADQCGIAKAEGRT